MGLIGERVRGNTMRGNRAESVREERLPLSRSPRGPPKTSEGYIGNEDYWVHVQGFVRQHSVLRRVLERVLGKGSQKGSEKEACYGFYSQKGF